MIYIYIILIGVLFISCVSSVEKNKIMTDFSQSFLDSVQPNRIMKGKYITYNVEIKGYVNDTIIIYFTGNKKYPTYLSGEINKRYWEEYSARTQKYLSIAPYRATKGKLKIKYGLYK